MAFAAWLMDMGALYINKQQKPLEVYVHFFIWPAAPHKVHYTGWGLANVSSIYGWCCIIGLDT